MSKFGTTWKTNSPYHEKARQDFKRPGDKVNVCAEYVDTNGGTQYRFFANESQFNQFKEEGLDIRNVRMMAKGIDQSIVEKPEKFERCVQHVKANNPGANAYAVCNAVLSDKAFANKSVPFLTGLLDRAIKDMGIAAAGPIPESKLAGQDLEGTATTKSLPFTSTYELAARIKANQKPTIKKGSSFKEAWSRVRPINKVKL